MYLKTLACTHIQEQLFFGTHMLTKYIRKKLMHSYCHAYTLAHTYMHTHGHINTQKYVHLYVHTFSSARICNIHSRKDFCIHVYPYKRLTIATCCYGKQVGKVKIFAVKRGEWISNLKFVKKVGK